MFFYIGSVLFFWEFLVNNFTTGFSETNISPCMYSSKTGAYEAFLTKHVRSDAPETLDQNQWQAFIRQVGMCNRPVQSFIPYALKQQVDNVCSPSGGKTYMYNLCVSKQEFNFITVYVDNNCVVTRVMPEKKYLLLACDEIEHYCRPVHFQINPNNDGPDDKNPDCKNLYQNQAQFKTFNLSLLILTLLSDLTCFM
ncbi:uncharacterized protein LOC113644163 [Tachysurus ichikawai]